jgi:eukaryotic-like serine/threonine-protein kinase
MALFEDGTLLSRYTILGKLATGGMAEVYLARQSGPSGFSKLLVLKVILPHLAEDPEFLQMFHNEAQLAALLNHPNVVQIFDFGEERHDDDNVQYMAMEYIDGLNLRAIVKALEGQGSSVPQAIAVRLVSDACSALEYAHNLSGPDGVSLAIIHRDVSLANILLTYTGQVKLVDFGIAKAAHTESFTSAGALRGKYRYMPPEQIRGVQLDRRADIFSLGVVLYRLLTGKLPFEGDNHAQLIDRIVNRSPVEPRTLCPEITEELERITLKTLHKDPDQRYQRAGELQIDLEAHLLATGNAVMPYNLSRFMEEAFPSGEDDLRTQYQRLAGISSRTPARSRRPPEDEPATGPLPRVLTPSPITMEQELLKSTVTGDDTPQTGIPAAARDTLQDMQGVEKITQVKGEPPLDAADTRELPHDQEDGQVLSAADETMVASLDEILAEAQTRAQAITEQDGLATLRPDEVSPREDQETLLDEPAVESDALDEVPTELKPGHEIKPETRKRAPVWLIPVLILLCLGGGAAAYFLLGTDNSTPGGTDNSTPGGTDNSTPGGTDNSTPGGTDTAVIPTPAPTPDQAVASPDLPPPTLDQAVASPDLPTTAPDQDAPKPDLPPSTPDQATSKPDLPPPTPDRAVAATPDLPPPAPSPALAAAGTARLSVSCPLGGEVLLNGKRLGKAPLREVEAPAGSGRLVLRSRKHHFSISRRVTLEAGKHRRLQLTPRKGTIRVLVRPWAKVSLDGKALGTTPLSPVETYEGRHTLQLVNDKLGVKRRERVTVRPGKESVVKVRLEK